jgi:peptidoglycan/LPS O-acetylase OafA/YrhL
VQHAHSDSNAAVPAVATRGRSLHLEALRGFATLMVVATHAQFLAGVEGSPRYADGGLHLLLRHSLNDGIVIFFALSGYLIGGPFVRSLLAARPFDLPGYVVRRLARIVPAYWVAFAVLVVLLPPVGGVRLWQLPLHLLLLHNSVPGESRAIYPVAWTLGIEALFYVLVPCAWRVLRIGNRGPISASRLSRVLVAVWVLSALSGVATDLAVPATSPWWAALNLNISFALFMFCPGMLVALAEARSSGEGGGATLRAYRWLGRHPMLLVPPALALFLASARLAEHPVQWLGDLHYQFAAAGSGLALVVALNARPRFGGPIRLLAAAGTISYSLYLWHWMVVTYLTRHPLGLPQGLAWSTWAMDLTVLLGVSVLPASVSWALVESPFQDAASAWASRRSRRPVVVARPAAARPRHAATFPALVLEPSMRRRLVVAAVAGAAAAAASIVTVLPSAPLRAQAGPRIEERPVQVVAPQPIVAFGQSLKLSSGVTAPRSHPAEIAPPLRLPIPTW